MSSSPDNPRSVSPDDSLPPVEPPNAGFIVRLFVVPAIIVGIIVACWVLINWWAQADRDPQSMVRALGQNNAARWQAAHQLTDALNDRRDTKLKENKELAQGLIVLLQGELKSNRDDDDSLRLRVFLCSALGNFRVPEVLPVLVEAEASQRGEKQVAVRLAALNGIVVFLESNPSAQQQPSKELLDALLNASRESEPLLRSTAAFALGRLGTPAARERLVQMLNDANTDVRFDSATMLARNGGAEAIDVLIEMLDSDATHTVKIEVPDNKQIDLDKARKDKHLLILHEALTASGKLSEANASANLQPLRTAVEKLAQANVAPSVTNAARKLLQHLDERAAAKPAEAQSKS